MKNLEGFDSIDDLKQAISLLTQQYDAFRQTERAAKIAEAIEIIENYGITAEELGLTIGPAIQKPAKRMKLAKDSRPVVDPQAPSPGQQGLW